MHLKYSFIDQGLETKKLYSKMTKTMKCWCPMTSILNFTIYEKIVSFTASHKAYSAQKSYRNDECTTLTEKMPIGRYLELYFNLWSWILPFRIVSFVSGTTALINSRRFVLQQYVWWMHMMNYSCLETICLQNCQVHITRVLKVQHGSQNMLFSTETYVCVRDLSMCHVRSVHSLIQLFNAIL